MTNRMISGQMPSGEFVVRVSIPGYDVLSEPLGSPGICFDTRLTDIGTVISAGLIMCGGSPVVFPAMNYVPIVKINRWDGNVYEDGNYYTAPTGGVASGHTWITAIGVVTNSSLSVIAYPGPGTFAPTAFYNPNGQYYLYSIFAAG